MRVLILSSSTGGGHDMRARAFQAWTQRLPELGITALVHRPLDVGPGLYRFGVGLYNWIQRHGPWMHHIYFNFLELTGPNRSSRSLLGKQQFLETLREIQPDVLLSVHPSLNHGYFDVAREWSKQIRCVTYCGELFGGYGFSRNWVNPKANMFIGAVAETGEAAKKLRMSADKTAIGGFLLRPPFHEPAPSNLKREEFIRSALNFNPEEFILLLSASSRGANNHLLFLEALKQRNVDVQTVVLCGKSIEAKEQVKRWSRENPKFRLRLLPHNTDVAMLLRCVSCVVARPGTGATSEAIISECPLLLNCLGLAMPQEWITVKFCRKHGVAKTIHNPGELAETVAEWIKIPSLRAAIVGSMRAIKPAGHPRDILRQVANIN